VYSGCSEPYESSLLPAEASFDGRAHGPLKVRKTGYLGSLSNTTPSLRLELGDEHFRGRAELTLNNPTLIEIVAQGRADAILLARAFLRDPYWTRHAAKGTRCRVRVAEAIRPRIAA
jgi:hypothetical protein